jgi:raffinose/stachyose/melibiose transport system substrate-binding protein
MAGQASFNDPGVVEVGRRMQELVKAGAFPEGFNGLDYDTGGSRQLMYAGKVAMELQTSSYPATAAGEMKGFEQKLDFATFPSVPNGKGQATGLLGGMIGFAVSQKTKARDASVELLRFLTDDTARDAYIKNGRVPSVKGGEITDPLTKKSADTINGASSFQNYWDQALPPELGQEQLDVSQALLAGSLTPEAAAQRLDEVAKRVVGKA